MCVDVEYYTLTVARFCVFQTFQSYDVSVHTVFARGEADGMIWRVSLPQHGADQRDGLQSGTKHEQTWNVAMDLAEQGTESAGDGVGKRLPWPPVPMTQTTTIAAETELQVSTHSMSYLFS